MSQSFPRSSTHTGWWLLAGALAACSVFPDAPEARSDGGAGVGGGNGGAGGTAGSATGGGGASGSGTGASGGSPGGGGSSTYDCDGTCSILDGLVARSCPDHAFAVVTCAHECGFTGSYPGCASEQSAMLSCLNERASVICWDGDYAWFDDSCDVEIAALYGCVYDSYSSGSSVSCDGSTCQVAGQEFCCVEEGSGIGPHCHVAGDCYGVGKYFKCDASEDCAGGNVCCATRANGGELTGASCQPSCGANEVAMCTGSGSCPSGSCVQSPSVPFYEECQ